MTKHAPDSRDSTRQAGALSGGEIEVTPAMVEAGVDAEDILASMARSQKLIDSWRRLGWIIPPTELEGKTFNYL